LNVNGNEIADRLAKEAAKEAEQNQSDSHNTITKQDVKKTARDHITEKWQNRWNFSNRGRFYHNNTILIAINSPNNIDPLLQTGCFSSVVSSSTNTIAPAPHGPGLLRHEPSVNAIAVLTTGL
jgi:hypothetical protein